MHRKHLIPFSKRVVAPWLSDKELNLVENLGAMTFRFFTRGVQQGFSVFGKGAVKVGEILFENRLDAEEGYIYPDVV